MFNYFNLFSRTIKISNLLVSVALICLVIYLKNIFLPNICILYCLGSLNSVLFLSCLFRSYSQNKATLLFTSFTDETAFLVVTAKSKWCIQRI